MALKDTYITKMGIRETVTSDGFSKYHVRCVICGRMEEVFPADYINDPIAWTHNLKFKKCKYCRVEENNKKLKLNLNLNIKQDNYEKEFNKTLKRNSIATNKHDTTKDTIKDTTIGLRLGLVLVEKGRKLKDI